MALVFGSEGMAHAQEPRVDADGQQGSDVPALQFSAGGTVAVVSAFVWRGFVLDTSPSLQPSVWVSLGPLTVTSWSNASIPGWNRANYTEHDLSVEYSRDLGAVNVSLAWTNYIFSEEDKEGSTNELSVSVALPGYLHPRLQVFEDIGQGKGTYISVGVSHDYPLARARLTPSLAVGYNRHQWTDRSGFSDVTAGVAVSLPLRRRLLLQPFLNYTHGLEPALFGRMLHGGVTLVVE